MSAPLNVLLASGGFLKNTANITAQAVGVGSGYSAGTAQGALHVAGAGTLNSGGTFGGRTIVEVSESGAGSFWLAFCVKGFAANPGAGWLQKIVSNGVTKTPQDLSFSYTWDATHGAGQWSWPSAAFGYVNGTSYNVDVYHQA